MLTDLCKNKKPINIPIKKFGYIFFEHPINNVNRIIMNDKNILSDQKDECHCNKLGSKDKKIIIIL